MLPGHPDAGSPATWATELPPLTEHLRTRRGPAHALASKCAGIPGDGGPAAIAGPGVRRPRADPGGRRRHGPDADAATGPGAVLVRRAGPGGGAGVPGGGLAALAGGATPLRPAGGGPGHGRG